jgi:hypothetical protein
VADEAKPAQRSEPAQALKIPEPQKSELQNAFSQLAAVSERLGFQSRKDSDLKRTTWDWWLKFILKVLLFIFVIFMNVWWVLNVLKMVWQSGTYNSSFHLADSVLIALVSTSIANFLALVLVVARHLFPHPIGDGDKKTQYAPREV